MISNPVPETLSEVYAAREFNSLYRISPGEIAETEALANPGIPHAEAVSPEEELPERWDFQS
jgi:hypothetical protein